MTDLIALAARVEKAEGADRMLDGQIGGALRLTPKRKNIYQRGHYVGNKPVLLRIDNEWPRFTASLDAAMSLVPEGWSKSVDDSDNGVDALVELYNQDLSGRKAIGTWFADGSVFSRGKSWATAITAASLRARAAMETNDG